MWTACRPVTLSGSAFNRQRASRLRDRARVRAREVRPSCSAASTRRCIRTRPIELGGAHAVVRGDGDVIWPLRAR